MYKIGSFIFIILLGYFTAQYGWVALLWVPGGFIIGILLSSNIILPVLLGVPLATSLIQKKQMKSTVFLSLLRAPIFWFVMMFLIGFFLPSFADWVLKNKPLYIAILLGFILILLSPLSMKVRTDFRSDFDKAWGKYYTNSFNDFDYTLFKITDKKQLKEIGEIIKVSTNFYNELTTTHENEFHLNEHSKYRLLSFCLYATFKSCESYISKPDLLFDECYIHLKFILSSNVNAQKFLQINITKEAALEIENNAIAVYKNFVPKINFTKVAGSEFVIDQQIDTDLNKVISYIESGNVNETYPENDKRIKNLIFIFKTSFSVSREAFLELMK